MALVISHNDDYSITVNLCMYAPAMFMQALKTASEQPTVSQGPPQAPTLDTLPPTSPLKQITPAKHTPSAEQQAILALTGDLKTAPTGSVVPLEHEQQLQQQQQQPVGISSDLATSMYSELESAEQHIQLPDEGVGATQRQLEDEFEGSIVDSSLGKAESEPDSVEVCKCMGWLLCL